MEINELKGAMYRILKNTASPQDHQIVNGYWSAAIAGNQHRSEKRMIENAYTTVGDVAKVNSAAVSTISATPESDIGWSLPFQTVNPGSDLEWALKTVSGSPTFQRRGEGERAALFSLSSTVEYAQMIAYSAGMGVTSEALLRRGSDQLIAESYRQTQASYNYIRAQVHYDYLIANATASTAYVSGESTKTGCTVATLNNLGVDLLNANQNVGIGVNAVTIPIVLIHDISETANIAAAQIAGIGSGLNAMPGLAFRIIPYATMYPINANKKIAIAAIPGYFNTRAESPNLEVFSNVRNDTRTTELWFHFYMGAKIQRAEQLRLVTLSA